MALLTQNEQNSYLVHKNLVLLSCKKEGKANESDFNRGR